MDANQESNPEQRPRGYELDAPCRKRGPRIVLLLAFMVLACCEGFVMTAKTHADGQQPIHVFVVRHAEAQHGSGRDPDLTPVGEGRAHDLARLLSSSAVSHLFASEYQRTQQTLAPLAEERGLEVEVVSARDPEAQIAALRALAPGSVAVVAGHSNTVPTLVKMLGGTMQDVQESPHGLMFDESQFDRLVLVVLQPQASGDPRFATSLEMRYGDPNASKDGDR